jgi:hypothetical protein
MKKLKLEALEVTSFETTSVQAEERGTVRANSGLGSIQFPVTRKPEACPNTAYLDCTLACSIDDDTCFAPCP